MHLLTAFNHVLNFMAPAAWMALALAVLGAFVYRGQPSKPGRWRRRMVLDFLVGLLVLVAGLLLWGRDGKMLTYLALVLACACSHWVGRRS